MGVFDRTLFTPADQSHTDTLIELMQEFYVHEHLRFDERAAREALSQILANRAFGIVHLITHNNEIAGYIVLTFGFSLEFQGRDAFIDEVYLRENFRGQGIGKASLQFVEGVCQKEGIKALHLEVERENMRAQSVYRQAGYKDHDRYLLTKRLNEK